MAKLVKQSVPKKYRKGSQYAKYVIREMLMVYPKMTEQIECAILLDEEDIVNSGNYMFFPEGEDLLHMLWHAKMDVDLKDIDLPSFPRGFMVSWPNCKINDVDMAGCGVWVGTPRQRDELINRWSMKYLGRPLEIMGRVPEELQDEPFISVVYQKENTVAPEFIRCTIPNFLLKKSLESSTGMADQLGTYSNEAGLPAAAPMSPDEQKVQHTVCKLVIRLMVYMKACPEMVREGYPEGKKARTFKTKCMGDTMGSIIRSPISLTKGGHGTPKTHWRNMHFRSYPRRKNGTKRIGVVMVHGTIVNADVDPLTVNQKAYV